MSYITIDGYVRPDPPSGRYPDDGEPWIKLNLDLGSVPGTDDSDGYVVVLSGEEARTALSEFGLGDLLNVSGRLVVGEFLDEAGRVGHVNEIIADNIKLLTKSSAT